MYAFLDPMWTRCLLVFIISLPLYVSAIKQADQHMIDAIIAIFLFCICSASFVGFILFLLKGI